MAEKPMNNFKTAVNELMNGKVRTDDYDEPQSFADAPTFESPNYKHSSLSFNSSDNEGITSVFSPDLIIEGTVKSKSDIKLNGYIKGDVSCGGSIVSTGTIDGNIDCTNVMLAGSTVNGNINVRGSVTLDNNSSVTGDIVASALISDGKIKGNVILKESISLKANASILGNVKAKNISIESGTTLVGNIEIKAAQIQDTPPAPAPAPAAVTAAPAPAPVNAPAPAEPQSSGSGSMADLLARKEAMKDSFVKKDGDA